MLVLGGTGEAAALAAALAERAGVEAITSLAGRTRDPAEVRGALRVGGFGGVDGLTAYLRDQSIDLLVDATHPFAALISRNAASACAALGVRRLTLSRPPWAAVPGDRWIPANTIMAAAGLVPRHGKRVFLTVGRQELAAFAGLSCWFLVRMIDPPEQAPPLEDCEVILGRGPFDETREAALLRQHGIDLLVSKNSGGPATYGKIAAARALGLPVVMIERPEPPGGETVETAEAALAWIGRSTDAP